MSICVVYLSPPLVSRCSFIRPFSFFPPPDFCPPLDPTALLHCSLSSRGNMSHTGWSAVRSLCAKSQSFKIQQFSKGSCCPELCSTHFLAVFSRDADEFNWKAGQIGTQGSQGNVVIIISRWSQSKFIGILLSLGLKKQIGRLFFHVNCTVKESVKWSRIGSHLGRPEERLTGLGSRIAKQGMTDQWYSPK